MHGIANFVVGFMICYVVPASYLVRSTMSTKKTTEQAVQASTESNQFSATEYAEIHDQRMALIRSYNLWYAIGCAVAFGLFWLILNLSITVGSRPIMTAGAVVASIVMWFAYRAVLSIDREVVALYPRIIYLEFVLGYDFYRDYLRRRPRGNSERSFIERCEQIKAENPQQLWDQIYSFFDQKDFPASRRLSSHFKSAAYLSVALFWLIVILILAPQYFPGTK